MKIKNLKATKCHKNNIPIQQTTIIKKQWIAIKSTETNSMGTPKPNTSALKVQSSTFPSFSSQFAPSNLNFNHFLTFECIIQPYRQTIRTVAYRYPCWQNFWSFTVKFVCSLALSFRFFTFCEEKTKPTNNGYHFDCSRCYCALQ